MLCTACLLLAPAIADADLRVLMAFDASGHHVQRLLHVPTSSTIQPIPSDDGQDRSAQGGFALAEWLDANDRVLLAENFPDPRVVHGPQLAAGTPTAGPRVRLEQGAYLLAGPDMAVTLRITLPYSGLPAMESSVWRFDLH